MADLRRVQSMMRVLWIVDSVYRAMGEPVDDGNLLRLDYFADAFSRLWGLDALDRYRQKVEEPRSLATRRSLDTLVVMGLVEPVKVRVVPDGSRRVTAEYYLVEERARFVLEVAAQTAAGRREQRLVNEVVFAAAPLLETGFLDAVHLDATFSDTRVGPNDVLDLGSDHVMATSEVARRFESAISSLREQEPELTHLYLAHLEKAIHGGD